MALFSLISATPGCKSQQTSRCSFVVHAAWAGEPPSHGRGRNKWGGRRWSRPGWPHRHREVSRGSPGPGPRICQRRAGLPAPGGCQQLPPGAGPAQDHAAQSDTHNRRILSMGGGSFLSGPQGSRARQWLPKEAIGPLYEKKKHLFKV